MVDSRHVSTLDILPTIADVLGITIPWHVDGTSVLKGGAGSPVVDVAGVREPYAAALAQRRASLARQLSLFGSGDWGAEFAGTGPYRRLVGASVSGLDVASDDVGVRAPRRRRQQPRATLPSQLGARSVAARRDALGRETRAGRGAGREWPDRKRSSVAYRNPGGGPVRFSELVGENAFRVGRNAIRVYVVSGDPAAPRLEDLSG